MNLSDSYKQDASLLTFILYFQSVTILQYLLCALNYLLHIVLKMSVSPGMSDFKNLTPPTFFKRVHYSEQLKPHVVILSALERSHEHHFFPSFLVFASRCTRIAQILAEALV